MMETETSLPIQIIEQFEHPLSVTETLQVKPPTADEIQFWLITYLAEILEMDGDKIDVTLPFERYGLDSSAMIILSGDLQNWLGCQLDPTLLYDYPTIKVLVKYLVRDVQKNNVPV